MPKPCELPCPGPTRACPYYHVHARHWCFICCCSPPPAHLIRVSHLATVHQQGTTTDAHAQQLHTSKLQQCRALVCAAASFPALTSYTFATLPLYTSRAPPLMSRPSTCMFRFSFAGGREWDPSKCSTNKLSMPVCRHKRMKNEECPSAGTKEMKKWVADSVYMVAVRVSSSATMLSVPFCRVKKARRRRAHWGPVCEWLGPVCEWMRLVCA